jgi:hypothetical protein
VPGPSASHNIRIPHITPVSPFDGTMFASQNPEKVSAACQILSGFFGSKKRYMLEDKKKRYLHYDKLKCCGHPNQSPWRKT